MKILFVSDCLGSPSEQRGMHNFSMSLIEALQGLGASIDLIVERPPGRSLAARITSRVVDLATIKKSVAIAEVFRFFGRRNYSTDWIRRKAESRYTSGALLKLYGWAYIAFVRLWAGGKIKVENDPQLIEYIPETAWHLTLPDNFIVAPAIYTEMVVRLAWGLPADVIDASGYDLVVIDTPLYFTVKGIDSQYIVSVVHDIFPLRDPVLTPYWRNLFFGKLESVMALNPNFAFVSEYTRSLFKLGFPTYRLRNSIILYPTLRKATVKRGAAAAAAKETIVRYAPGELNSLEASVSLQDRMDAQDEYESNSEKRIATKMRFKREAKVQDAYLRLGWDSRLPYFVTIVSDEPRKNIGVIIKAFIALKGTANMVVLGNVDGKRYIGSDADAFGHIRFTGYIPESEKNRILANAEGMIFSSFTEGFGIPITEGAAYGKPVLCSDIDVFREVAGDDAFYFDPYKEDTLVAAIETVLVSPEETHARAERLKARVLERFTTDATAKRVSNFLAELGLTPNPPSPARSAADVIAG